MRIMDKNQDKKFIAWNLSDNGYSLGSLCENCIPRMESNAKYFGIEVKIEELHDHHFNRCVFCGKELVSERGRKLESYKKWKEELADKIHADFKTKKITRQEYNEKIRLPILIERAINCELSNESYLSAYRQSKMMHELNNWVWDNPIEY
jgi:hypothetical protein